MYQDNVENQKPIKMQCRCGWVGMSNELTRWSLGRPDVACPRCHAKFEAWPQRT